MLLGPPLTGVRAECLTPKKDVERGKVIKLRLFVERTPLPRMSSYMNSLRPIWTQGGETHGGVARFILLSPLGGGDSEHDPSWGKKKEEVRGKREHGSESTRWRDSR